MVPGSEVHQPSEDGGRPLHGVLGPEPPPLGAGGQVQGAHGAVVVADDQDAPSTATAGADPADGASTTRHRTLPSRVFRAHTSPDAVEKYTLA